jgi:hypothetical protein
VENAREEQQKQRTIERVVTQSSPTHPEGLQAARGTHSANYYATALTGDSADPSCDAKMFT